MSNLRRSGRLNPRYNSNQVDGSIRQNPHFSGDNSQFYETESIEPSRRHPCNRYFNTTLQQEFAFEQNSQLNSTNPQNSQNSQNPPTQPEIKGEPISPEKMVEEKLMTETNLESSQKTSATTKALFKMNVDEPEKKRFKRTKVPLSHRKKLLNKRLSKILTPKSASSLLNELKPGCSYKIEEKPGVNPPVFVVHIELDNNVIGTGEGMSKSQAKNLAAENAIKVIVSNIMSNAAAAAAGKPEGNVESKENEDTPENLPWAGLASFAMYKMFAEWQSQGTELPPAMSSKLPPVATSASPKNVGRKELPENASELHPAVLLNLVIPGITAVEIERETGPQCRVKMGYMVDGQMYTGVGGNKKEGKWEAAKAVLSSLYGLNYPS